MAEQSPHNGIINRVAEEVLAPAGLFRLGRARRWCCDCGYFLIEVELQPHSWRKGTFCNVVVSFLWGWPEERERNDGLRRDACFRLFFYGKERRMLGDRQFAAYEDDDELFRQRCLILVREALRRVNRFRRLTNLDYARYHLNDLKDELNGSELRYHRSMLKKLAGAEGDGVRQWVIDGITRRRGQIRKRSAFRKLPEEFVVAEPLQWPCAKSRSWKRRWRWFWLGRR